METEDLVFVRIQCAFRDVAEIHHVFFVLHSPGLFVFFAVDLFKPDPRHVFFECGAVPEPAVASAENSPQYALAGHGGPGFAAAQSVPLAMRATLFG
jgi:hypothetical protein